MPAPRGAPMALALLLGLGACAVPAGPQAASLAPPVPASPRAIIGATPAMLNESFGAPALRRVDGTAQVWLYHSDICGMDVILYPDSAGTPRVAAAVPNNGDGDPTRCLQSFARPTTEARLERAPAS